MMSIGNIKRFFSGAMYQGGRRMIMLSQLFENKALSSDENESITAIFWTFFICTLEYGIFLNMIEVNKTLLCVNKVTFSVYLIISSSHGSGNWP